MKDWKQPKLQYEDFRKGMRKIVADGATPYFHCHTCQSKTWMFEGSFEMAYKQLWCKKCDTERYLSADYDTEL